MQFPDCPTVYRTVDEMRTALLTVTYQPLPVKRVEIPKAN